MNRPSFLATLALLAAATLGAGCKKDPAQADVTPATDTSAAAQVAAAVKKEPAPEDTGTKFTKKPPAVGAKRTEESKTQTNIKFTMMKKTVEIQEEESSKKDEEVLEVAGDMVTKLKVTIVEDVKSMAEGGKPLKAKPTAIAGKTYVLVAKDGKTTVLNDKEKPAPKAEAALVTRKFASFGKPDPVTAALPDRALKPGDEVPELADTLSKEMKAQQSKNDKIAAEGAKVVFKGKEGDVGVFEVSLTMKVDEGPFKVAMPLTGKMSIRVVDGWPATVALEGPLNLELGEKDKAQGVEGGGTIKVTSSYTYR